MLPEIEKVAFEYFTDWKRCCIHRCAKTESMLSVGCRCCERLKYGDAVMYHTLFYDGSKIVDKWQFDFNVWKYNSFTGFWIPAQYWIAFTGNITFNPGPWYDELVSHITVQIHSKHNDAVRFLYTYFIGPFGRCTIVLDMFISGSLVNANATLFGRLLRSEKITGSLYSRLSIEKRTNNGEVIYVN